MGMDWSLGSSLLSLTGGGWSDDSFFLFLVAKGKKNASIGFLVDLGLDLVTMELCAKLLFFHLNFSLFFHEIIFFLNRNTMIQEMLKKLSS